MALETLFVSQNQLTGGPRKMILILSKYIMIEIVTDSAVKAEPERKLSPQLASRRQTEKSVSSW